MKTVTFYNEKGNVSVKTRNELRKQAQTKILSVLQDDNALSTTVLNANGGFSIPLAVDSKTGDTIFAVLDLSISTKNPTEKTERKKKSVKVTTEVVVPSVFDEDEEEDEEGE